MLTASLRELTGQLRYHRSAKLVAILAIALTLLSLDFFILMSFNLGQALLSVTREVGMTVFLEDGLSTEDRERLLVRIRVVDGVGSVRYVSPNEALARFRQELGAREYLLEGVEGNPLPASVEVEIEESFASSEWMAEISKEISALEGVGEVAYGKESIRTLDRAFRWLVGIAAAVGLIAGLSAVVIAYATARLTLEARRDIISIMTLVGASRWYVWRPVIMEGTLQGFTASALALGLLYAGYWLLATQMGDIRFLPPEAVGGLLVLGAGLGALGSHISLRAHV